MSDIEDLLTIESPVRRGWLTEDLAQDEILAFEARFGPAHTRLACHAAFPLFLTPELVNLIRINFLEDQVPWIAEADLLLSSLCRQLDEDLFVVDPGIREVLLADLLNWYSPDEGIDRLNRLADFLLAYVERYTTPSSRLDVLRAHRWIIWSLLNPAWVVEDMTALLRARPTAGAGSAAPPIADQILITTMIEVVRDPLEARLASESYRDLIETAQVLAQYWYRGPAVLDELRLVSEAGEAALSPRVNPLLAEVVHTIRPVGWTRLAEPPPEPEHSPAPVLWPDSPPTIPADARDLELLQQSLTAGHPILMVCGAPGTGKTRLLLELGRRLAPDYPDGRIYLDLAASTEKPRTPDDAIRGVLDALGVPRPSAPDGSGDLHSSYRAALARRRAIVFLDDANAEQLAALYCPSLMLWLVASRQPFPHDDASIIRLQRPRMIPPVPAPWVNRPEEAILRRLLTPPMGGPLVLVGPAGRGKTSLAAKLAHDEDLRQHYPDGILWCDLLHADLTTVLLQLADVLGFEPGNRPDPGTFASQVAERLKEGRYLLILDHADDPAAGRAFLGFGTAVMLLIAQDKQPFRSLGFVPLHLSPPVESTRSDALYLLVPSVSSDALQAVVSERMPPSVFISYSYDSDAHAARVLALADALCDHGIDVILDRYVHPRRRRAGPPGWSGTSTRPSSS